MANGRTQLYRLNDDVSSVGTDLRAEMNHLKDRLGVVEIIFATARDFSDSDLLKNLQVINGPTEVREKARGDGSNSSLTQSADRGKHDGHRDESSRGRKRKKQE